jgi:excisionase family DNA binding protein
MGIYKLRYLHLAKIQRMWEPEETALLLAMVECYPLPHIAKRLGRSIGSVRGKVWQMGLSPRLTLDRFSSQRLADLLGVSRKTVTYWIEQWGLKATKVKGKARPTYRIRRKDFVAFYHTQRGNTRLWALKDIDPAIVEWLDS